MSDDPLEIEASESFHASESQPPFAGSAPSAAFEPPPLSSASGYEFEPASPSPPPQFGVREASAKPVADPPGEPTEAEPALSPAPLDLVSSDEAFQARESLETPPRATGFPDETSRVESAPLDALPGATPEAGAIDSEFPAPVESAQAAESPREVESPPVVESPPEFKSARERLIERFAGWLDRSLAEEPELEGVPVELIEQALDRAIGPDEAGGLGGDLASMASAITALTGEVRLQGRAFKQLSDSLAQLASPAQGAGLLQRIDQLAGAQLAGAEQLAALVELARRQAAEASARAGAMPDADELLNILLDLYDRLDRGRRLADSVPRAVEPAPAGWLGRLLGRGASAAGSAGDDSAANALREGYDLTLARLEAAWRNWGIERIGNVGDPFDPLHMEAVEVADCPPGLSVPEGGVLEVYRSGYAVRGRLLAPARVKVARAH